MVAWFRKEKEIPLVTPGAEHGPVELSVPVPPEAGPAPEQQPQAELAPGQEQQPAVEASVLPKRATPPAPAASSAPSAQPALPKSPTRKEVEATLSEGLAEVYRGMNPQEQAQFRTKGDQVASAIEQMVSTVTATTRRVLQLIREWLMLIPRVNKFFLEQESKLKTDEIMKLQRRKKAEQRNKLLG